MLNVNSWDRESWSREDEDYGALDKGATCVVEQWEAEQIQLHGYVCSGDMECM